MCATEMDRVEEAIYGDISRPPFEPQLFKASSRSKKQFEESHPPKKSQETQEQVIEIPKGQNLKEIMLKVRFSD